MLKKRAMAYDRWVTDMASEWISDINVKRLDTGYADNQPSHPYWVKPCNYSVDEWYEMGEWMLDTMGDSNWYIPNGRWVGSNRKYWFRDERDRTMFILKWS